MAAPTVAQDRTAPAPQRGPSAHEPFVPAHVNMPEFTWPAVVLGSILGIIFGASSLYLVLKVGMTVSASIPVAVLSITLFRAFSRMFGIRRATILENNIVQTTGSAGESIAFGVGVTIPALLLLGFDMNIVRVMTVGVLGGLLGILMMIPLRRAFIVQKHGVLTYPEGTACAEVLIVGEEGGATAKTVFVGFGLAFLFKVCSKALGLWREQVDQPLQTASGNGLRGGMIGGELSPELMGVGYIIGPRIASIMVAGGVLAYLVIIPMIYLFGDQVTRPVAPATRQLISQMDIKDVRNNYVLYIGAGAVAAGGILSMFQALPLIVGSIASAVRDFRAARKEGKRASFQIPRTERDLPLSAVLFGSLGLIIALAAAPSLGLGFGITGLTGAVLIVFCGFLFVTVSSRLTGEIGSSSNPISGMTVATLLITCLVFLSLGMTGQTETLTALTVASVVCIAASNAGTTSQDLKTGFLVGGTPRSQQIAILIGALTSAVAMGFTLLLLNNAGTVYTNRQEFLPRTTISNAAELPNKEKPGGSWAGKDDREYYVLQAREREIPGVPPGKYLLDEYGRFAYLVDPGINGHVDVTDDGQKITNKFEAPKTRLMALIIGGILNQRLPWELVGIGVLIAVVLELAGVPSLPFAVGVYLPIQTSAPIFVGGILRWGVDRLRRRPAGDSEGSPGVLLSSGYIAGGALAGVLFAMLEFTPKLKASLDYRDSLPDWWNESNWPALGAFALLAVVLVLAGMEWIFRGSKPAGSVAPRKK